MSRLVPVLAVSPSDEFLPLPSAQQLHAAVAEARRRHRPLIAAAGQWALSQGLSLPADHIALWAAAAADAGYPGTVGGITGPWRVSLIAEFLDAIEAWCAEAGCSPPTNLAESFWHLYGFLATTGRLHPASDALDELRATLAVFANFNRRHFPTPAEPGPSAA